jgi:hypothetical protein
VPYEIILVSDVSGVPDLEFTLNIDEHLARTEKDQIQQAKLSQKRTGPKAEAEMANNPVQEPSKLKPEVQPKPEQVISDDSLDEKIEAALSDDVLS